MARTKADPMVVRPRCPEHPDNRVWLDGFEPCRWSDAHRRPRYRCVTAAGTKGHSFSLPVAVRQPTERHPDSGAACLTCEHVYGRHEGVRTGAERMRLAPPRAFPLCWGAVMPHPVALRSLVRVQRRSAED